MKIPRFGLGSRPSSVSNSVSYDDPTAPIAAVAGLVAGVGDIAADLSEAEAKKWRQAAEAKQAITNEVEAGRRGSDFDALVHDRVKSLQDEFVDNPGEVFTGYSNYVREEANKAIKEAPNSQVALQLAKATETSFRSGAQKLYDWQRDRQTQKAKIDLSVIANRTMAGARDAGSLDGLGAYIAAKQAELEPTFVKVYGNEAPEKLKEMRVGATQEWVRNVTDSDNPIAALVALSSPKGAVVDNLEPGQRESLRKDAEASFFGLGKKRALEAIRTGYLQDRDLVSAYLENPNDPALGGSIYSMQRSIDEQRKAIKVRAAADSAALKKLGIDPQGASQEDLLKTLNERERLYDALDYTRRAQLPYDAADDPTTIQALLVKRDKMLKKASGKKLNTILEQQADIAVAMKDKKITTATAAVLFKDMTLALDKAIQNESTWHVGLDTLTSGAYQTPQEAMNSTIQGRSEYRNATPAQQAAARVTALSLLTNAASKGAISEAQARKIGLRAIQYETGTRIPGADD